MRKLILALSLLATPAYADEIADLKARIDQMEDQRRMDDIYRTMDANNREIANDFFAESRMRELEGDLKIQRANDAMYDDR